MLQDLIETQYFELELPLAAGEVSNIFHYHRDQEKYWKMSNKPLRALREGKIVADFSKWSDIVKDSKVKYVIDKNSDKYTWFPTFIMHKKNLFKLYDSRFAKTDQGMIAVVQINEKPSTIHPIVIVETLDDTEAVSIGKIGEEAVATHFNVDRSEDWYDSEKDGMIGELTYEVKTFQLNHRYEGFLVQQSQWQKLDGVDMLLFVRVPDKENDLAKAYLVINHKTCYHHEYVKDKRLRCYPLTNCLYQFTIDKDKSANMLEMSKKISTWRK
jgi:hypothetical protein